MASVQQDPDLNSDSRTGALPMRVTAEWLRSIDLETLLPALLLTPTMPMPLFWFFCTPQSQAPVHRRKPGSHEALPSCPHLGLKSTNTWGHLLPFLTPGHTPDSLSQVPMRWGPDSDCFEITPEVVL